MSVGDVERYLLLCTHAKLASQPITLREIGILSDPPDPHAPTCYLISDTITCTCELTYGMS